MAQGFFWKWRRINLENDKEEISLVQGALRPSVLGAFEYVFPKEALTEVMCIMGITNPQNLGTFNKKFLDKARLATLRRMFGCKKIPLKYYKEAAKLPPSIVLNEYERGMSHLKNCGVTIHPIGIREDAVDVFSHPVEDPKGHLQEML